MRYVSIKRQPLRWLHSAARQVGDFLWGAFLPVRDAF
jgi:hypothetical protein